MAISAALVTNALGPELRRTWRHSDFVRITGATGAAGDTASVDLPAGRRNCVLLGGAFRITAETPSATKTAITIKAIVALGDDVADVEVLSDAI